jgi:hypothetical protein
MEARLLTWNKTSLLPQCHSENPIADVVCGFTVLREMYITRGFRTASRHDIITVKSAVPLNNGVPMKTSSCINLSPFNIGNHPLRHRSDRGANMAPRKTLPSEKAGLANDGSVLQRLPKLETSGWVLYFQLWQKRIIISCMVQEARRTSLTCIRHFAPGIRRQQAVGHRPTHIPPMWAMLSSRETGWNFSKATIFYLTLKSCP